MSCAAQFAKVALGVVHYEKTNKCVCTASAIRAMVLVICVAGTSALLPECYPYWRPTLTQFERRSYIWTHYQASGPGLTARVLCL